MDALKKVLILFLCLAVLFFPACGSKQENVPERADMEYIFVHGLNGWGSYDKTNRRMPYWGMMSGDLLKYLGTQGFSCHAASVDPTGSAWDRACELYAQLSGSVTDYGKAHSERCGHERFGRDYSSEPLTPDWDSGKKIVLLGHSFGGATIRLFSELLANGSAGDITNMDPEFVQPPEQSVKMAVIVVSTVPIMCVYPFLQKYFVKGVMVGALKG